MSRWFRHYAGMCRDEKLVRVALRSKQPIERVVWVWAAILESASEVNDNGRYDFDIPEASYFLRSDESDISCIFDALESLGRISQGAVCKWSDRQFRSDSSADRVRDFRNRQKSLHNDPDRGEVTECNVTPCYTKQSGNGPDTDTDTDIRVANATLPNEPVGGEVVKFEKKVSDRAETLDLLGEWWNALAPAIGRPSITKIASGGTRERHCLARAKEMAEDFPCLADALKHLAAKIRGSPFLSGKTKSSTNFLTFDWVMNPTNYQKIVEGNYDAQVQQSWR